MTNRQNALAILNYRSYERVPVVHFGFWPETVRKWAGEGYVDPEIAEGYHYQNDREESVARALGFDFGWGQAAGGAATLFPAFEKTVLETMEDGSRKVRNAAGAIIIEKSGIVSIPQEVGYTLTDRDSWDRFIEPRLRWTPDRVDEAGLARLAAAKVSGKLADKPLGVWCGSLFGEIRNMLGVENSAYIQVDDQDLFREIIDRVGQLCLSLVDATLDRAAELGISFDYGHFWEDICFKNGPLINPAVFATLVGPWYRRVADRLARSGIGIVSLDCDGMIDSLIPTWLANGVNTMFPIEVGTWRASIAPWRERYGASLLGVGGMEKAVFSRGRAAVDAEIERLKPLVDLGGYIPCPDHRLPPDAEWDTVAYYCERFREEF